MITSRNTFETFLDGATFIYPKDFRETPLWKLKTSTGEVIEYQFKRMQSKRKGKHHRYMLAEVRRSNAPHIKYKYRINKTHIDGPERLTEKRLPEGRFTKIQYYEAATTMNGISIKSSKDSRVGRVSALHAPVGVDRTPIRTHRFFYFLDKEKKSDKPMGGTTTVYDALNNKKMFGFSKEHRLIYIDEFDRERKRYRLEQFYWGGKKSDDYTCLRARVLKAATGRVQMCRVFKHDSKGNIIKETLAGNLSGEAKEAPIVNKDGRLENAGCEKYVKDFTYTSSNLLASEDDGEVKITYEYNPETDKVQAQFLWHHNAIKERTFYKYDSNGVLIKEIVDDGWMLESKHVE